MPKGAAASSFEKLACTARPADKPGGFRQQLVWTRARPSLLPAMGRKRTQAPNVRNGWKADVRCCREVGYSIANGNGLPAGSRQPRSSGSLGARKKAIVNARPQAVLIVT